MPAAGAFRGEGENGAICPEAPDVRAPKSMIEIKSKYLYVGGGEGTTENFAQSSQNCLYDPGQQWCCQGRKMGKMISPITGHQEGGSNCPLSKGCIT